MISDQDSHLRKKVEGKVMEEMFKWLTSIVRQNQGKHTHIKKKKRKKKSLQERLKWAAKKKIK